ncbi:PstS family phosphate ABC transporter substrate-binding protein [[Mycoplasma] testudinis]|uniref:PstS family phosphate ABC transporter substrate-binding protein n=1 Tax=[Mycoplasma] testudinis TaxID=33924 RepID=UPI000484ABDA|nr:substrate-binding domain-containing protein [[Mycoplasma] testudinis]
MYSIGFVAIIGATSLVSACGNFTVLDARGSSSVQPFLNALATAYSRDRNIEINVQSGGSSTGIQNTARGTTLIGTSSKSPRGSVVGTDLENDWKIKKIKTITLAKDAVALLFVPPSGFKASDFAVNQNNILDLYNGFAGFERVPLSRFYIGSGNPPANNIFLKAYARSGGSNASGTAEAFLTDSGFDTTKLDSKVRNALNSGVTSPATTETAEANADAYRFFQTEAKNIPGAIIYLGLGFIQNNFQRILLDGFDLMNYQIADGDNQKLTTVTPTIDNVEKGLYRWVRPFNIMTSLLNPKVDDIKNFVSWILFSKYLDSLNDQQTVQSIYQQQGLIPLNENEIKNMFNLTTDQEQMSLNDLVKNHLDQFWTADYDFSNGLRFGAF